MIQVALEKRATLTLLRAKSNEDTSKHFSYNLQDVGLLNPEQRVQFSVAMHVNLHFSSQFPAKHYALRLF
jgi:hypothetical protein